MTVITYDEADNMCSLWQSQHLLYTKVVAVVVIETEGTVKHFPKRRDRNRMMAISQVSSSVFEFVLELALHQAQLGWKRVWELSLCPN